MKQQHNGRRGWPRLAPILMPLLLTTLACPGGDSIPSDEGFALKAGSAAPEAMHLFDMLDSAELGGVAQALVESPPNADPEVLLDLNFEDGSLGALRPFAGFDKDAATPGDRITVVPCERGDAGNQCVKIEGGLPHGMSLRSAPIPISPSETYRLSYGVRGMSVATGKDVVYGGASVILYEINKGDDPIAVIADSGKERGARLPKPPPSYWIPSHYGNSPWSVDADVFTPPQGRPIWSSALI